MRRVRRGRGEADVEDVEDDSKKACVAFGKVQKSSGRKVCRIQPEFKCNEMHPLRCICYNYGTDRGK
jgi:hypothetical protein